MTYLAVTIAAFGLGGLVVTGIFMWKLRRLRFMG